MLEEHEEDIEEWYFHHQSNDKNDGMVGSSSLENFLCRQGRVLKSKADRKCLDDVAKNKSNKRKSKNVKGELRDTNAEDDNNHTEL